MGDLRDTDNGPTSITVRNPMAFVNKYKSFANSCLIAAVCLWIGTGSQIAIDAYKSTERAEIAAVESMTESERVAFIAKKVKNQYRHLIQREN